MRHILLTMTLALLVVGCDGKKSEVNSASSSSNTGEIIDGYFIGAWFKIKVPTNFSVKPSLRSESLNTPTAFDSVLFVSPDKEVEFYVYFPKLMGRPTDFEFSKNNENMASESKTGDSKKTFEYSTYTAKDNTYTKSLVVITASNTTNYAFGVKYKNQIAYDRYKTEYLEFKKSLVENRDDSKKESTSNNTQKEQKQKPPQPSSPQQKGVNLQTGMEYSYYGDSSCTNSTDKVCLNITEYEQLCKITKGMTKLAASGLTTFDNVASNLLLNGSIESNNVSWEGSTDYKLKCRASVTVSGIYKGSSRRVTSEGGVTTFTVNKSNEVLAHSASPF